MFGLLFKQLLVYAIMFGAVGFVLIKAGDKKGIPHLRLFGFCAWGIGALMLFSGLISLINAWLFW